MDFARHRERAIADTKKKLREPLTDDIILIHVYRAQNTKNGLSHWLQTVLPEIEDAAKKVKKEGADAWDPQGNGAAMKPKGWEMLQDCVADKEIDIEAFANDVAPNLSAVCGWETASELLSAAGGLTALSRMTQRDCQALGNESGQFGGKNKKGIMEQHELATSDRALRILCSRSVLAARIDDHNGEFKGDKLHQEVLYAQ